MSVSRWHGRDLDYLHHFASVLGIGSVCAVAGRSHPGLFPSDPESLLGPGVEHEVFGFAFNFHGDDDGPVPHFDFDGIGENLLGDAEIPVAQVLGRSLPTSNNTQ